ncbi:MAG TPA: CsbD family protein [Micromonosporaceae bacterium]|jgi:uncharacterized protein YjbJ (UPF0337 family)
MTDTERAGHKVDEFVGKAKETVGEHTDNESLANEGRADQTESKVKQVGDDLKDAVQHGKDALNQ